MEARTIILTFLVFALWTSTTTGQTGRKVDFCDFLADGSYCEHCWQPIQCTNQDISSVFGRCGKGEACTVASGASFCTSHTGTPCACSGAVDQCDAYNPKYLEYCDANGPVLVDKCPITTPTCFNGGCGVCTPGTWYLTPDCTKASRCGTTTELSCNDGEYVTSAYFCAPLPVPACDGSCTGYCPNPVDCTKWIYCDGTTAMYSGDCLAGQSFDILTNTCINTGNAKCTFLNGCNLEVGSVGTTTTTEGCCTVPPAATCNSSTGGNRSPTAPCSQLYYVCAELVGGAYDYIVATCLGDYLFSMDPTYPYCTDDTVLAGC